MPPLLQFRPNSLITSSNAASTSYLGLTGTRGLISNGHTSAYQSVNSVAEHYARDTITTAQVAVANTYVASNNSAETSVGNAITHSISIQYPIGNNVSGFNQMTFGGQAQTSLADQTLALSDAITLSTPIPSGSKFRVRRYITVPASSFLPYSDQTTGSEGWHVNASGVDPDLTMGGVITVNASGFLPTLGILSMTTSPTLVICGDSLQFVVSATPNPAQPDSFGNSGIVARGLGPNFGYSKFAVSSNTLQGWVNSGSPIRKAMFAYCSHVINCLGGVDFGLNTTAANAASANAQTMWGWAQAAGAKAFHTTICPRTNSTDGWVTAANQTTYMIGGLTGPWKTFNDGLRNGSLGADGFFDPATKVEFSAPDSGIWDVDPGPTPLVVTSDNLGTHPSENGEVRAVMGVNPALIHR